MCFMELVICLKRTLVFMTLCLMYVIAMFSLHSSFLFKTRPQYNLVVDEDVKKPTDQTNKSADEVFNWASNNFMTIHPQKTKYRIITKWHKHPRIPLSNEFST